MRSTSRMALTMALGMVGGMGISPTFGLSRHEEDALVVGADLLRDTGGGPKPASSRRTVAQDKRDALKRRNRRRSK